MTIPDNDASLRQRVLGRSIDGALWGALVVLVSLFTAQETATGETTNPSWAELFAFFPPVLYETAMVAWRGQTLGKIAAKTRVVMLDGSKPGPLRSLLRAIVIWSFTVGLMTTRWEFMWLVGWVLLVVVFAPVFVTPTHRGTADLLAGTHVERLGAPAGVRPLRAPA
jgi:uncharacterized RDD family membrane protein YckC